MRKNYLTILSRYTSFLLMLLSFSYCNISENISFKNELSEAPVIYGISKIKEVFEKNKRNFNNISIQICTSIDTLLGKEAFEIETNRNKINISGGDAVGVMYGLLHIKELFEQGETNIKSFSERPYCQFRAIKFNLPWDSYRRSESLQLHDETCRDTAFWRDFLNMMAENRFNKLTLWSLHPFNYMVKTKKYPEACRFSDEEMKTWEEFWKSLFRMAKERGIETYIINWNIFVPPDFAKAHNVASYCLEGEYFVNKGDTSEIIKDYTREAVKEVIDKYSDLTGLGITLGEGMGGMSAEERQKWILDSFIQGVRSAQRKIKFIYRAPLSAGKGSHGSTDPKVEKLTRSLLDTISCFDGEVTIELKFNWSHAHSCPELVKVHGGELTDAYWSPEPINYKLAWMIRNEDFFALRWGQPDFIKDHIKINKKPWVNGYFIGSECYIPAKDYFVYDKYKLNNWAFERQWMFYKLWGRLLFNPETPDEIFKNEFIKRFPEHGAKLFEAQRKVSKVPLILASYWHATWDFTLYSEGMLSILNADSMRLISLNDIINKKPMAPNYVGIKDYIKNGMIEDNRKCSPVKLADSLILLCNSALVEMNSINAKEGSGLFNEVTDIKIWSFLGLYFANKLLAAVSFQNYLDSKDKSEIEKTVSFMKKSFLCWKEIVKLSTPVYKPMPLVHYERNKEKFFHWSKIAPSVEDELKWINSYFNRDY